MSDRVARPLQLVRKGEEAGGVPSTVQIKQSEPKEDLQAVACGISAGVFCSDDDQLTFCKACFGVDIGGCARASCPGDGECV